MQLLRVIAVLCLATTMAAAHPPPECEHEDRHGHCRSDLVVAVGPQRPAIEWSSWVRFAIGTKARLEPADVIAAGGASPMTVTGHDRIGEAALGGDVTLGVTAAGNLRIGPWLELRGFGRDGVIGGAELVVTAVPKRIDMFLYDGQGILCVRGGANLGRVTGQVAYGYLAPWNLFGPQSGRSRYMIGARFVGTFTRSLDDGRDWSATLGLEFEPVGALRYVLGIRSWYH